jgi:RNA exonuclease 1
MEEGKAKKKRERTNALTEEEEEEEEEEGEIFQRDDAMMKKRKKKMRKSDDDDDDDDAANAAAYSDIYGPNASATFHFLEEHRHRVHLQKLSDILASVACQSSGINCDYGRFTNKPLVKKIAVVLAPGLEHKMYVDTFGALHCKNMKRIFRNRIKGGKGGSQCVATKSMNPTAKGATHARSILYNGGWASGAETKKKREAKYKNDEAAQAYRLAKEQAKAAVKEEGEGEAEAGDDDNNGALKKTAKNGGKNNKTSTTTTNNERVTTETKLLQFLRDAPRKLSVKSATLTAEDMADMRYPLPTLIKKKEKAEVKEVLKLPEGGFVCTQPAGMGVANAEYPEIVAMDCEMVTIETGLALARCSVVDDCGTVIYDKLVLPPTPIVNYNTEFSGITKEQMRNVTTTLEDVQKELLELIPSECVIAGHSLENDLMMLKMCHPNVVDTVQMYPHKRGAPFRNALRFLTERYLRRKIQHEGTHDSVTDARATLELVYLKLIRGETFGNDISENFEDSESLFDHIAKENKTRGGGLENECEVLVFETITNSNNETIGVSGATETYKCVSDDDVTMKMQMSMREAPEDMSLLCFGYLRELEDVLEKHALKEKKKKNKKAKGGDDDDDDSTARKEHFIERIEATQNLDSRVAKIWDELPANSLLLVATAVGDSATLRYKQEEKWSRNRKFSETEEVERKKQGLQNWTDEEQEALNKRWHATQFGVALCAIKPVLEEGEEKRPLVAAAAWTNSQKERV